MREVRGAAIAMIFQEPMTALNPLRTIGDQIAEMFSIHTDLSKAEIGAKVLALLADVRIPDPEAGGKAYPHQLSGGQRQRAMIAMALALDPKLLIADEPTTALDVTTQAQILKLIRDLQQRRKTAVLFITHDFGVVAEIADRVAVMQNGVIVEQGTAADVLNAPQHAYTRQLIAAVPPLTAPPPRALAGRQHPDAHGRLENLSHRWLSGRGARVTPAVKNVSLNLPRGATLGIVGESGSGKSTLARCIVRLIDPDAGSIVLEGRDWAKMSRESVRRETPPYPDGVSGPVRLPQSAPQGRPIWWRRARSSTAPRARRRWRTRKELLALVGLDPSAADRYPHEFSGGQRQRIGLARALALKPDVLVADEPVSALDVSVQAQVLELLAELRARLGLSIVFITHDLRVAAQICDLVAVMKDGEVVEHGLAGDVFGNPQHAYTRALLNSIPGGKFAREHDLADA